MKKQYSLDTNGRKIVCKICTKKKGKKIYFEYPSWFHCPECGRHGFASIYGGCCTDCSNVHRQPEFEARQARIDAYYEEKSKKKWYQFWK